MKLDCDRLSTLTPGIVARKLAELLTGRLGSGWKSFSLGDLARSCGVSGRLLGTRDRVLSQVLDTFNEDVAKDWRVQPRSGPLDIPSIVRAGHARASPAPEAR